MPADQRRSKRCADVAANGGPGRHASVVVVDDRATNRSILAKLASELTDQVSVSAFAYAAEALDAIACSPPDLIITDYKMPDLTGAEFVRRLRANAETFDVPVIVVTAYEDKQFRYDALQAGASDFLLTPLDRLEFVQRGRNLLTMRRQQQLLSQQAQARERRLEMKNRLRERELRFSEEKFRLVINTLPALINAVDSNARIAFVNAYHANLFGMDPGDALGRDLASVMTADYAARHDRANASVFDTGEPLSFEEALDLGHGGEKTFLTSKAPLRDISGEIANVVTVSVDITEQKRAERELAMAKEAAQRANRAKSEFLANISHELRTPLNAVLGFADVGRRELLGPIGTARYRDYQEDIYASGQQLLALIEDLLDVSQLDLGRLQPKPAKLDIATVVRGEVRAQQENAARHDANISTRIADGLGEIVTDPVRLRQIVGNLLSNAVKYAEGGAVEVQVDVRPDGADGVRVIVADNGPGMNAAEVEIALSRFGRVRRASDQEQSGVGLGLPIAHDLATLLGGELTIDSAPGQGTRVIVDLPNMPAQPSDRHNDGALDDGGGGAR